MAIEGVLLRFEAPRLVAFEIAPKPTAQNTIIWISGLGEGLLCPSYFKNIAASLPATWSIAQVLLSSSYDGWTTSSLAKDATELSRCVTYFRKIRSGKIILMGHSTGCQDVMEYVVGPGSADRPAVDGGILQAGISDGDAMRELMAPEQYKESVEFAQKMIAEGKGEEIMPTELGGFFGTSCCARRWLSLASPDHRGEDDYFSVGLSDEQLKATFGNLPKAFPLSILYSGADAYVPNWVDKEALVKKWINFARDGGADVNDRFALVIEGGTHNYMSSPEPVVQSLVEKVVGFVEWVTYRDGSRL